MSSKPYKVLVTAPSLAPEAARMLEQDGAQLDFMADADTTEAGLLRRLAEGEPVDAVLLRGSKPFSARVLGASAGLKIIAKNGAGVDSVDLEEAGRRGIAVAVSAGANAEAVAEHALALMLALTRELPTLDSKVRAGGWAASTWQGRDFRGSVVGIVGYGAIGRVTATLAATLGAAVIVLRRQGGADPFEVVRDLDELLPRVDILSLHCPLTDATRGLLGPREFARMKPGALLVNTARGAVVDERALAEALQSGHLGGAGLDTFETEPLAPGSALREMPRTILTPHVAGVTRLSALRVATTTARNIIDFMGGRMIPVQNHVAGPSARR